MRAPSTDGTSGVDPVPFILRRLGVVMEPESGNPLEGEGVLNPAAARGPDGELYLFPRLVSRGNYSRRRRVVGRFDGSALTNGVWWSVVVRGKSERVRLHPIGAAPGPGHPAGISARPGRLGPHVLSLQSSGGPSNGKVSPK